MSLAAVVLIFVKLLRNKNRTNKLKKFKRFFVSTQLICSDKLIDLKTEALKSAARQESIEWKTLRKQSSLKSIKFI